VGMLALCCLGCALYIAGARRGHVAEATVTTSP
jgi:hypothetical protein